MDPSSIRAVNGEGGGGGGRGGEGGGTGLDGVKGAGRGGSSGAWREGSMWANEADRAEAASPGVANLSLPPSLPLCLAPLFDALAREESLVLHPTSRNAYL